MAKTMIWQKFMQHKLLECLLFHVNLSICFWQHQVWQKMFHLKMTPKIWCHDHWQLTLWSLLTRPSLYSWLPSIMPVSGLENHSLNSRWDWKTCGMRKCMSDHSSIKLFCRGVPVRRRRRWLQGDGKKKTSALTVKCKWKSTSYFANTWFFDSIF